MKAGGRVIASYQSGLNLQKKEFFASIDLFGISIKQKTEDNKEKSDLVPYTVDYLLPTEKLINLPQIEHGILPQI